MKFRAAFLALPGASQFYVSGCVVYSGRGYKQFVPKKLLESSGVSNRNFNYRNRKNYIESKVKFVNEIAKNSKHIVRSDWFVCESGTVGPNFSIPGVDQAFTAVAISGPNGLFEERLFFSDLKNREMNMQYFTKETL